VLCERKRLGWSLDVLAKRTGLSKAFLCDVERGRKTPGAASLVTLATVLNKSLDWFVQYAPAESESQWPWVSRDDLMAELHNAVNDLTGNTEGNDCEWFARTLWQTLSDYGMGSVDGQHLAIDNATFAAAELVPNRFWTGKARWESLSDGEQSQWRQLARGCQYVLPRLCERIGRRYQAWAKATRDLSRAAEAAGGERG
jgi:transcriptional regulator with XRE-family HTH domain